MKEYYPIISGSICAGIGYIYGYMYEKNKTPIKRVFLDPNFGTITRPANWDEINWIIEKNIKKNPIVVFAKSIFSIIQGKWETVFPQINAGVNNDKQAE